MPLFHTSFSGQKTATTTSEGSNHLSGGWFSDQDSLLLVVLFILALVFVPFGTVSHVHAATQISYSCGDLSSGHCYGVKFWGGANGADTRITLHPTNGGNDGFVNTEMWLQSSDTSYWVEAGIRSCSCFNVVDGSMFFWADSRPNGGGYHEHFSNYLYSTDWSQPNALVRITRSGTSSWNVSVNDNVTLLTGTSADNNITIGYIEVGMELAGTSGAYAPLNYFTNNRWMDNSGYFHYQTNDGTGQSQNGPIFSGWATAPTSSSTGGSWYACIGGSGC